MIAAALIVGAIVSWADRSTGEVYCGRLSLVQDEVAWIVRDTNPQWYAVEPVSNVREGCPR